MFFRKRRLRKHVQTLGWHVHKIGELERVRDDYERDGLLALVLAVNYELISHATRGLAELRQAEEISRGELSEEQMREFLSSKLSLPAIRRDQIDSSPPEEVQRLYHQFAASGRGKSLAQRLHELG